MHVFASKLQAGLAGESLAGESGGQGICADIPRGTCECGVHKGQVYMCMFVCTELQIGLAGK